METICNKAKEIALKFLNNSCDSKEQTFINWPSYEELALFFDYQIFWGDLKYL